MQLYSKWPERAYNIIKHWKSLHYSLPKTATNNSSLYYGLCFVALEEICFLKEEKDTQNPTPLIDIFAKIQNILNGILKELIEFTHIQSNRTVYLYSSKLNNDTLLKKITCILKILVF